MPHRTTLAQVVAKAGEFDLAVLHTSAPSFASDVTCLKALKAANPALRAGFVGAHVAVDPAGGMRDEAVDFVAGNEFDLTIKEVAEGRDLAGVDGIAWRDREGQVRLNRPRSILHDMDELPFVTPVYKEQLKIENYFIGYLKHPYLSLYAGRGCKSRCTFCLWPQTVGGHRYRTRSVGHVVEEVRWAMAAMPQVREFFFDDDTFTDDLPRAEAIARELGRLGVTWSCNAKANVPRDTLKILRDNGLRLLLVGFESGNQRILHNVKKGMLVESARRFARDCRDLGITVHGTFILGLPGETRDTIEETIRFATEINPHTLQVSLAAPYPGTALHRQAVEHGWLVGRDGVLRRDLGALSVALACSEGLRRQMAAEIETQFEAFRATGLPLDHVNAHRHFHLHPVVCLLVLQIGRAFGLRALRVPFEPVETVRCAGGRAHSARAETTMSMHQRHRAARAAVIMPDALLGLRWSGALTPPRLAALLRARPPGLVEVYTHPATGASFDGAAPGYRYRDELDALCDPACRESLGSSVRPCGYADITPTAPCFRSAPARLT